MSLDRPKQFTLENYAEIYDYYRSYNPDANKIKFAANVLRLLYNPQVSIAEDSMQTISEHTSAKKPIIYALNHLRMRDQFVVGTAIWAVPDLRQNLLQGVVIPAKPGYFTGTSKLPLPTTLLEDVGMMPVFRATEAHGQDSWLFRESTQAYLDTCAFQLSRGINLLVSPEGTRNSKDPNRIQSLKQGVAKTALLACELGAEPLILPSAVYYEDEKYGFYKPRIHFGEPFIPTVDESAAQITSKLHSSMQHALDRLT